MRNLHLPADKILPDRLSRHLYDFHKLLNAPVKEKALSDLSLLDRVAEHKKIHFPSAWANVTAAAEPAF